MRGYTLKLYVTGQTPNSMRAIANLKQLCDEQLEGNYEVMIIDILKEPHLAENDKIIATPTLVKVLPAPLRKIIGDLSDTDKVLLGLDVVGPFKEVTS